MAYIWGDTALKESECAAKAVHEKFTAADKRHTLEKQLAAECALGFAMGRSPLTASVIRMIVPNLPDLKTNARGMLLLCDLVDEGDLEEAMGQNHYRGKLYSDQGAATWSLESVTLQNYLGFHHMHTRGILHQDFKPANLMLDSTGVVKITDFGENVPLPALSRSFGFTISVARRRRQASQGSRGSSPRIRGLTVSWTATNCWERALRAARHGT